MSRPLRSPVGRHPLSDEVMSRRIISDPGDMTSEQPRVESRQRAMAFAINRHPGNARDAD